VLRRDRRSQAIEAQAERILALIAGKPDSTRGKRLRASIPHGHWKTTTFVAGLRLSGMIAPMVLDGPINGRAFQAYVDQVLVPELRKGDIVVMDNLGSHKGTSVRAAIEAAERTVEVLWNAIGRCLDRFTPPECAN
jgi:hypothetical protein